MTNDYHFITNWRVAGNCEDIYDIISEPLEYTRWWPSVYLKTELVTDRPGERRIRYHTKGWLPYTLNWESYVLESKRPERIAIRALGDFDGRGIWTFSQNGSFVNVNFDWKLRADKALLRNLSFLLKPMFSANHRWAMQRGWESLELELARRHAETEEQRRGIPSPPGPNRTSGLWLMVGAAVVGISAALLIRKARNRAQD